VGVGSGVGVGIGVGVGVGSSVGVAVDTADWLGLAVCGTAVGCEQPDKSAASSTERKVAAILRFKAHFSFVWKL
jgi:hypothetical protein